MSDIDKPLGFNKPAFVTGSYAYGKPGKASDIDLVVPIDEESLELLKQTINPDNSDSPSLNLIWVTDPAAHKVLQAGTRALKKRAPVTRDEACAVFDALEEALCS